MALAERLGKTLQEVDAISLEELRLWAAWFDMKHEENEAKAREGRRRK